MNNLLLGFYIKLNLLISDDDGQDLVEYALVVAIIAFGAVTAMKGLSTEIKTAFITISSDLGSSLETVPSSNICWIGRRSESQKAVRCVPVVSALLNSFTPRL